MNKKLEEHSIYLVNLILIMFLTLKLTLSTLILKLPVVHQCEDCHEHLREEEPEYHKAEYCLLIFKREQPLVVYFLE